MRFTIQSFAILALSVAAVAISTVATTARAADVRPAASGDKTQGRPAPETVAATVDGREITVADVDLVTGSVLQGRKLNQEQLKTALAEILKQLVDRDLVQEALRADGVVTPEKQLDKTLEQTVAQMKRQQPGITQLFKEHPETQAALRRQLSWQIVWDLCLSDKLTNGALEAYFKKNHRDYDGTQLRASHVLLRPGGQGDPAEVKQLVKKAEELREQIVKGKLSFENAARQYSGGPSRKQDGDIGFFPRRGLMEESFSKAAFALKKDEVSKPVTTSFGVHLIKVTDVRPGQRDWSDAKEQLKTPAAMDLFETMAKAAMAKATIEYTGVVPYFKDGGREVVAGIPSTMKPSAGKSNAGKKSGKASKSQSDEESDE